METLNTILNASKSLRLALVIIVLCSLGTTFLLSAAAPAQSVQLKVVNNSAKEIRYLYLSPAENDNWSADQLHDSAIGVGATRTINFSWEQATVKLVGEDQDGCFLSKIVTVASTIEWTIASDAPRNCGAGR